MLRSGAPIVGPLEVSHGGEPADHAPAALDPNALLSPCASKNQELLESLTEGKHSEWILSHVTEEAKLGRISEAVPASEIDWERALAARKGLWWSRA